MNPPDGPRPGARWRISDELGFPRTLAADPGTFSRLGGGGAALFLGLGPNPALAASLARGFSSVRYIECPRFVAQMAPEWSLAIPDSFQAILPGDLRDFPLESATLFIHEPGARLFPTFWGPVIAYAKRAVLGPRELGPRKPVVVIPADPRSLLTGEIGQAFAALGFSLAASPHRLSGDAIRAELGLFTPALFFSVNFQGFDPHGEVASSLSEAGIPAAVWCVDNPLHLLSALKSPFWKDIPLFVTDDWFIDVLTNLGASRVFHLPLAAAGHFFAAAGQPARFPELADKTVFVGRPEFPDKNRFFSGLRTSDAEFTKALLMLDKGERPDYAWWLAQLPPARLWPGKEARVPGFAAEETGLVWRVMCLRRAAEGTPLAVIGPRAWKELLPEVERVLPEVDYYGALAAVYRDAGLSLNLTSPLLPRGLTQRHFDVWAAGGTLVSDNTPGLSLFPRELTAPVTFVRPDALPGLARSLLADHRARQEIAAAWREEIAARHTYAHRARSVLERLGMEAPRAG